jgi:hypothetical protein
MDVDLICVLGYLVFVNDKGQYLQSKLLSASVGHPLGCTFGRLETALTADRAEMMDFAQRLRLTVTDKTYTHEAKKL